MNLVGKIFIVSILIMSVLFMAFAMAVYATHKNWKEVVEGPDGLKVKLDKAKTENRSLTDEKDRLKKQYDAEKAAHDQAVAALESQLKEAIENLQALSEKQAQLEKNTRDAVATMNVAQTNATTDREQLETLRTTAENARKDRDANFKEVWRLTEALNQAINEMNLLKKRTETLAADLAKADQILQKMGMDKNRDYSDVTPVVDGTVTDTREAGLVEISIGSDSGLQKGHKLEVYRTSGGQSTYVGRIEVVKTAPDKAVCRIDPKFQTNSIMVGDRVATKIN
jgi:hypothetical protein